MHTATVTLPGGTFWMGSDDFYPEERPLRQETVGAFSLDVYPVTVAQFAAFVELTHYVTTAEARGHSHVFRMTEGPVDLSRPSQWWVSVPGANWRKPDGVRAAQDDHPVVQVSLADAKAYAKWVGGRLPTEREWEYAARGGLDRQAYAWGNAFCPDGRERAHVWSGSFPWYYAKAGTPGTRSVGLYEPNGYGFHDLIGNCWELTASAFDANRQPACCSCSPQQDAHTLWVAKGGSHLCAAEYCLRYRPAARIGIQADVSTSHLGFRCAY